MTSTVQLTLKPFNTSHHSAELLHTLASKVASSGSAVGILHITADRPPSQLFWPPIDNCSDCLTETSVPNEQGHRHLGSHTWQNHNIATRIRGGTEAWSREWPLLVGIQPGHGGFRKAASSNQVDDGHPAPFRQGKPGANTSESFSCQGIEDMHVTWLAEARMLFRHWRLPRDEWLCCSASLTFGNIGLARPKQFWLG